MSTISCVRCLSEARPVHKIGTITTNEHALAQKALKRLFGME
jgi:hypothetical protein